MVWWVLMRNDATLHNRKECWTREQATTMHVWDCWHRRHRSFLPKLRTQFDNCMVLVNMALLTSNFICKIFATSPFVSGYPTVSVNGRHGNPALIIKYEESFSLHDVTTLTTMRNHCYNWGAPVTIEESLIQYWGIILTIIEESIIIGDSW